MVRRVGLHRRPTGGTGPDREKTSTPFSLRRSFFAIRSGSARRFATPVEPATSVSSPLLRSSV